MLSNVARRLAGVLSAASVLGLLMLGGPSTAQTSASPVKTVVLVHGALANASSWSKVIPLLQSSGLKVVAVEIPLTSLADDVAATRRAIGFEDGPVILVGHSWGGVVITEVGIDPKVAGLVYVAAIAPDIGQSVADLLKGYPPMPAAAEFKPSADGFLAITPEGMMKDFAQDLPEAEAKVLSAIESPIAAHAFDEKVTAAAWRSKPSWYIVAGQDRALSPDLELAMAKTIKATTSTLPASHLVMLSRPAEVAAVILEAAKKAASAP